jgi:heat shock protein HslJ
MSRRRRLLLAACVVILLLVLAGGYDVLALGGLPLPQPPAGPTWILHQYVSDGAEVPLPSGRAPTLYIQPLGHKLSGTAGCNSYFASYNSFFPGRLSISNLGQTVVYCLPASIDEFEARYLSDLVKVDSYHLAEADLVLSGNGGRLTMRFIAAGS